LTNKEILELLPDIDKLKNRKNLIQKQKDDLEIEESNIDYNLRYLDRVTDIVNGIPIGIHNTTDQMWYFHSIGSDYDRMANVYLNVQNNTTYGISIYWYEGWNRKEKFLGKNFTYEEAIKLAKDFVSGVTNE
jgi:hypothetical protein